jgi:hypothetical protein
MAAEPRRVSFRDGRLASRKAEEAGKISSPTGPIPIEGVLRSVDRSLSWRSRRGFHGLLACLRVALLLGV